MCDHISIFSQFCPIRRHSSRGCQPDRSRVPGNVFKTGFTLVELLVTVGIIAILAALLFPLGKTFVNRGKDAKCLANLRQIAVGCLTYANDNLGVLPRYNASNLPWNQTIAPYLGYAGTANKNFFSKLFQCPMDPRPYVNAAGNYARSYVLSGTTSFDSTAGALPRIGVLEGEAPYRGRSLVQVSRPSMTILIAEWWSSPSGALYDNFQNSISFSIYMTGWVVKGQAPLRPDKKCYHGNGYNFAFVDGHVANLTPAEVNPNWSYPKYDTRWVAVDP